MRCNHIESCNILSIAADVVIDVCDCVAVVMCIVLICVRRAEHSPWTFSYDDSLWDIITAVQLKEKSEAKQFMKWKHTLLHFIDNLVYIFELFLHRFQLWVSFVLLCLLSASYCHFIQFFNCISHSINLSR